MCLVAGRHHQHQPAHTRLYRSNARHEHLTPPPPPHARPPARPPAHCIYAVVRPLQKEKKEKKSKHKKEKKSKHKKSKKHKKSVRSTLRPPHMSRTSHLLGPPHHLCHSHRICSAHPTTHLLSLRSGLGSRTLTHVAPVRPTMLALNIAGEGRGTVAPVPLGTPLLHRPAAARS